MQHWFEVSAVPVSRVPSFELSISPAGCVEILHFACCHDLEFPDARRGLACAGLNNRMSPLDQGVS